jgi:hypothetical protein
MPRLPILLAAAPALAACTTVTTLGTAVPKNAAVFEARLLGTWRMVQGHDTNEVVITREGAAQYMIRPVAPDPSRAPVYAGRLGPLGAGRWMLELSPVGDTTKYTHEMMGRDSTRLGPPQDLLLLPLHLQLIVGRADSGLTFAVFNTDSVAAALKDGRLHAEYTAASQGMFMATLLLTESETKPLDAVLGSTADLPGALIALPRVGHVVDFTPVAEQLSRH